MLSRSELLAAQLRAMRDTGRAPHVTSADIEAVRVAPEGLAFGLALECMSHLSPREKRNLMRSLPGYVGHCEAHPETLIRYLGCHSMALRWRFI